MTEMTTHGGLEWPEGPSRVGGSSTRIPVTTEWLQARVIHCNASLWARMGFQWKGIGHTGTVSPLTALATNPMLGPVTVVVDNNGCVVSDLAAIHILDGDVGELILPYRRSPLRYYDENCVERGEKWFDDYCFTFSSPIWDSVIRDFNICTNCWCTDCGCCVGCGGIDADMEPQSHGYSCVM